MQPGWGQYPPPYQGYPPAPGYGPPPNMLSGYPTAPVPGATPPIAGEYPNSPSMPEGLPAGLAPALPPYQSPGGANQASPYPHYSGPGPQATVPPPMPMMQQPSPAPFQPTGRKRALLIGCNYKGASFALNGCVNDALCLRHLLKSRFGFQDQDIMMLTDDQGNPQRWPTRANMLYQMQMLVWDLRPGDSLFFSFSGHGSQVRDRSGDESDGKNETICPCDFKTAGMIVDDELNRLLVNPLPPGTRLHVVIDACHSGSAMDLEFRAKFKPSRGSYWKQEYAWRPSVYKMVDFTCHQRYDHRRSARDDGGCVQGTQGGECIQLGAARDSQTAADTSRLSGTVATGAATFSFIQAIERNGTGISYGRLLEAMFYTIASVNGGASPSLGGGFLGRIMESVGDVAGMGGQTPCLCANTAFDFNRPLAL